MNSVFAEVFRRLPCGNRKNCRWSQCEPNRLPDVPLQQQIDRESDLIRDCATRVEGKPTPLNSRVVGYTQVILGLRLRLSDAEI
jgi:hypothetical protein